MLTATATSAACLAVWLPGLASAAAIEVTVGGDGGDGVCDATCTLRDALTSANEDPGYDVVSFSAAVRGTILLGDGALPISEAVEVLGPGAAALTIDAGGDSRIFDVDTSVLGSPVTISGLTLTRGTAPSGGAILAERANLQLSGLAIVGNAATGDGGGVRSSARALTVTGTTIAVNRASGDGGGLSLAGAAGSVASISSSTISANVAGGNGGGIESGIDSARSLTVANSTVASNRASSGGGIQRSSTALPNSGTVVLSSTIVADNVAPSAPDLGEDPGAEGGYVAGFSLIEDPAGAAFETEPANSNRVGVDAALAGLEATDDGLLVQRPTPASQALEAGVSNGLATDQRGYPRSSRIRQVSLARSSDGTDIGAVELRFPKARIRSGPRGTISKRRARIVFGSETPGATYLCSFDFGAYEPCVSPYRARGLSDGYHQLQVRGTTGDGVLGRIARRDFVVDTRLIRPRAKAKRTQRQRGKRIRVRIKAGAAEDVSIRARGHLDVARVGELPLDTVKVAVPGRRSKHIKLEPKTRRAFRKTRKAIRKDRKVVAKVRVTIIDRGKHRFRKRLKVKLRI